MSTICPLISVVVPCFNAQDTLIRTLASVAFQTYQNIEVLIVDDGSSDGSLEIARRFAECDARMRVLSQPNRGVAAARNLGISAAKGEFVALIDADDLWRPEKLELQLRPLLNDPAVGVVYSWFEHIDVHDDVFFDEAPYSFEGAVLEDLCRIDFIGNGSNALIRTELLREIGGYDTSLRGRNAEGCEDWKVALQLAERCRFAVVRRPLTGYRHSNRNMSNNTPQMIRSAQLVCAEFGVRHPEYAAVLQRQLLNRIWFGVINSVRVRRWRDAVWLLSRFRKHSMWTVLAALCERWDGEMPRKMLRRIGAGKQTATARRNFLSIEQSKQMSPTVAVLDQASCRKAPG